MKLDLGAERGAPPPWRASLFLPGAMGDFPMKAVGDFR